MVEAIFLLCAISPGYMTSGLQEQYMKQLRRVAPFVYIKTLTRTAGGRPIVAIQLGCGCTKVLVTGTHHANESITGTLLWELLLSYCKAICQDTAFGGIPARVLYRNSMLYCVPLVNPDGADLVAGEIPEASPEYVQAAAIAAVFPQIPFPDGWKANLRGVDLNLNYPRRGSWRKKSKEASALTARRRGIFRERSPSTSVRRRHLRPTQPASGRISSSPTTRRAASFTPAAGTLTRPAQRIWRRNFPKRPDTQ